MTDSTSGHGQGGSSWPFDPTTAQSGAGAPVGGPSVAAGAGSPTPGAPVGLPGASAAPTAARTAPAGPPSHRPAPRRRRVPLWLLVLVPLLVIGAVVAFVMTRPDAPAEEVVQEVPEDVVVTLPPPTPTIEPVAREAGSALYDALPDAVLAYAMTGVAQHPPVVAAGAVEGYLATYSDGGATQLTVSTGQWSTPEAAAAALDAVAAAQTAAGVTPEQGTVAVDGAEVGRSLLVEREDGTGTVWWTNTTVLIQVDGPAAALRDVLAAFPL